MAIKKRMFQRGRSRKEEVYRFTAQLVSEDDQMDLKESLELIVADITEDVSLDIREVDMSCGPVEVHGQIVNDTRWAPELLTWSPDYLLLFRVYHNATTAVSRDLVEEIIEEVRHDLGSVEVNVERHGATWQGDRDSYSQRCDMQLDVSTWQESPRILGVLVEIGWMLE